MRQKHNEQDPGPLYTTNSNGQARNEHAGARYIDRRNSGKRFIKQQKAQNTESTHQVANSNHSNAAYKRANKKSQNQTQNQADNREIFDERRHQRRFDSLATLLELDHNKSVCTAVTIEKIDEEYNLSISINISVEAYENTNFTSESIADIFNRKLNLIRGAINELNNNSQLLFEKINESTDWEFHILGIPDGRSRRQDRDETLYNIFENFVTDLSIDGCKETPRRKLKQALYKLYQSSRNQSYDLSPNESDDLSPAELHAILHSNTFILLHPDNIVERRNLNLGVTPIKCEINNTELNYSPTIKLRSVSKDNKNKYRINYLHAEQLILSFFARHPKLPDRIGISKLCCESCTRVMQENHVATRGSHHVFFPSLDVVSKNRNQYTGKHDVSAGNDQTQAEEPISHPKMWAEYSPCPSVEPIQKFSARLINR